LIVQILQKGRISMKYKVGIYGSSIAESQEAIQRAQALGKILAQKDIIVVTGGGSGMPYVVALSRPVRTRAKIEMADGNKRHLQKQWSKNASGSVASEDSANRGYQSASFPNASERRARGA
jgi:hypothetical protein